MVQVLPQFDPGAEIGRSVGGGLSNILGRLGERQLTQSSLEGLKGLDLSNMSQADILAQVGSRLAGTQAQGMMQPLSQALIDQQLRQIQSGNYLPPAGAQGAEAGAGAMPQGAGAGDYSAGNAQPMDMGGQGGGQSQPMAGGDQVSQEGLAAPGGGGTPILNAQEQAIYQQLLQRNLQAAESYKQARVADKTNALQYQNSLREQAQNQKAELDNRVVQMIQGLDGGEGGPLGSQLSRWQDLGYQYFQELKGSPQYQNATADKIWSGVRQRLQGKINDLGSLSRNVRPNLGQDPGDRVDATRGAVQSHLRKYGDSPAERESLTSQLMSQGWSREEAASLVSPASSGIKNLIGDIGKNLTNGEAEVLVDKMTQQIKPTDSLYNIKAQLVREAGLSDAVAQAITKSVAENLQEAGKLGEYQANEVSLLDRTIQPSLYEVFSSKASQKGYGPLDYLVGATGGIGGGLAWLGAKAFGLAPEVRPQEPRTIEEYRGPLT